MSPPDPPTLDHEYRHDLDARLRHAVQRGVRSWSGLLRHADGADPLHVAERVREQQLPVEGWRLGEPASGLDDRWRPELHAIDFEWYFAPECAAELAARVAGPERSVLCLGTPTVAFALLRHPSIGRVTLVDRNPLAVQRGPGAHASLETIVDDLAAARLEAGRYDAVIFDAPWYPAALQRWLHVAARAARPGGTILFALLRPLHRPGAARDRMAILAAAQRLGRVTLAPGWLRYDSPRFEREAMATAALRTPEGWRRADLVQVQRSDAAIAPEPLPPSAAEIGPAWQRFVVGTQVVHIDRRAPDEPGELLRPIDGRVDFRYASISTRDPLRARIGLWTSRSRVARVRRPAQVAALLEQLAAGETAPAPLEGLDPATRERTLAALRVILDEHGAS